MKLISVFILLSLTSLTSAAQRILSDKTDPFTDVRTIMAGNYTLKSVAFTAILQVAGILECKNDSVVDLKLQFAIPDYSTNVQSNDTTASQCLIKLASGDILTGNYVSKTSTAALIGVGGKAYNMYTYSFSSEHLQKMINSECTNIKITISLAENYLFDVDSGAQKRLQKLCNSLINEMKK